MSQVDLRARVITVTDVDAEGELCLQKENIDGKMAGLDSRQDQKNNRYPGYRNCRKRGESMGAVSNLTRRVALESISETEAPRHVEFCEMVNFDELMQSFDRRHDEQPSRCNELDLNWSTE